MVPRPRGVDVLRPAGGALRNSLFTRCAHTSRGYSFSAVETSVPEACLACRTESREANVHRHMVATAESTEMSPGHLSPN